MCIRDRVRRKQLIGNGIVIGMIILIIATIIIVGALRGKKAKQEEVKAEVGYRIKQDRFCSKIAGQAVF